MLLGVLSLIQCRTAHSGVFESEGFTIKLPDGWDSTPQEIGETAVLFFSPPELGTQSALLISVQKSPGLQLHDLIGNTKATIKGELPGADFVLEREVEQDGATWVELVYIYSDMESLHLLTVSNGYSYTFTATTPEGLFRGRLPGFRQIFTTFRFR